MVFFHSLLYNIQVNTNVYIYVYYIILDINFKEFSGEI